MRVSETLAYVPNSNAARNINRLGARQEPGRFRNQALALPPKIFSDARCPAKHPSPRPLFHFVARLLSHALDRRDAIRYGLLVGNLPLFVSVALVRRRQFDRFLQV